MVYTKHNDLRWIRHFLKKIGADHIHVQRKGHEILLQSGTSMSPIPHVRFKKQTSRLWTMDIATHTGDWENTPYLGSCEDMLYIIVQNFHWVLNKID